MPIDELEPEDDYNPTPFDLVKLESLELDSSVNAESGLWSVFLYKDGYTLFINKGTFQSFEFKSLKQVLDFLATFDKNQRND